MRIISKHYDLHIEVTEPRDIKTAWQCHDESASLRGLYRYASVAEVQAAKERTGNPILIPRIIISLLLFQSLGSSIASLLTEAYACIALGTQRPQGNPPIVVDWLTYGKRLGDPKSNSGSAVYVAWSASEVQYT